MTACDTNDNYVEASNGICRRNIHCRSRCAVDKDKDTVPEKPLTLMTFTVEVRDALCSRDIVEGLTVRRNEGPALPPLTYELSIVPPAAVPTAAVRTIRSPFR